MELDQLITTPTKPPQNFRNYFFIYSKTLSNGTIPMGTRSIIKKEVMQTHTPKKQHHMLHTEFQIALLKRVVILGICLFGCNFNGFSC